MKITRHSRTERLAINALLAAVSFWLAFISHYFRVPFMPHMLTFDISDVPVFMSTLLFGFYDGALLLLTVSFIRAIFFSSAGWAGLIMRMANLVAILFLGIYFKRNKNFVFYLILAVFCSLIVKIPLNYIFWTKIYFMPKEYVKSIIIPFVVPYNIIKNLVNILLAWILVRKTRIFYKII